MELNLSKQDIDYIARVAQTEVDHGLKSRNPSMYQKMTQGVVDTIINRVASPQYPNTVEGVVNQRRQFSKIAGPKNLKPYGSVKRTPKAKKSFQQEIDTYVSKRATGQPSSVGGNLNYANPHYSTKNNLGWINALTGPKFGQGKSIHYHGTTKGSNPVGDYKINLGNDVQALAYNDVQLPQGNQAPIPQSRTQALAAQRGALGRGLLAPSPAQAAPMARVERAGLLSRATPPVEANPKAALLQAAYQKRQVPTPAPTLQREPASYTPKAADYANYMMSNRVAPPSQLPTGANIPIPAATPQGLLGQAPQVQPIEDVVQPTAIVPEITPIQRAKKKVVSHVKEQLKPQTIGARLIGGLLGGPMGAMAGPQIAELLNNRGAKTGLLGGLFNGQSQHQPMQTRPSWGNGYSEQTRNARNHEGVTARAFDGAQITGQGGGTWSRTSPITGNTSHWNSDGSRATSRPSSKSKK